MHIAIYTENKKVGPVDFRHPEKGNPGTGYALYWPIAITYALQKYFPEIKITLFAQETRSLPTMFNTVEANSITEAAVKAKEAGVDFFVLRSSQKEDKDFYMLIDQLKLPSIGRAALTPYPKHIRYMASSKFFKALVCVGKEQYDTLQDTPISNKKHNTKSN